MREELANVIRERTGLDEVMALQVAGVVLDFLKERLPAPLAAMLGGEGADTGGLGSALGGLFGKDTNDAR